jgi:hypothetical protein
MLRNTRIRNKTQFIYIYIEHCFNELTAIPKRVRKAKIILAENVGNNGCQHVKRGEH